MHDFGYVALNMKYVNPEDSGTYTCRAINDLGEAVTSATLFVQCKYPENPLINNFSLMHTKYIVQFLCSLRSKKLHQQLLGGAFRMEHEILLIFFIFLSWRVKNVSIFSGS